MQRQALLSQNHFLIILEPVIPDGFSIKTNSKMDNAIASRYPEEIIPQLKDSIRPSMIPPRNAPGTLPKPPMIAAVNPLRVMIPPISRVAMVIGATSAPPSPPIVAEKVKDRKTIPLTLIPIEAAASLFMEHANIPCPSHVYRKKMTNKIMTKNILPAIQNICGTNVAP